MIISSVKESKLTINTQKIESDTFFPESSLNPCDELFSLLKRKPFSTKARTIPGFNSVNKPQKMSLVGRVLINNTRNKNSTLVNTQNSTQMNSIVNSSKK